jgi:DNA replication protein DnaC
MLTTPTLDKLRAMNLMGMARALQEQIERTDYQALTFEERLGLMVDQEEQDRENRRLYRYLKAAKLRSNASIEDLDFHRVRGLDRSVVLSLADARWVEAHHNILITGPTGVGKTFTACALAQAAVRRGHTALYWRAPRMLDELRVARVDGRLPRLFAAWARVDVLVIDDLGLQALSNQQAADLLEVIEDRHQRRATIVTSQLLVKHWHESLGEPTIADAILDRLLSNSHRFELSGESLRGPKSLDTAGAMTGVEPQNGSQGVHEHEIAGPAPKRRATKPVATR